MAGKNVTSNVGTRERRGAERATPSVYEGSAAGARADTRGQREPASPSAKRRIPWKLGAAAASAALGGVALARTLIGKRRQGDAQSEAEVETSGARAGAARGGAKRGRRGGGAQVRTARGTAAKRGRGKTSARRRQTGTR